MSGKVELMSNTLHLGKVMAHHGSDFIRYCVRELANKVLLDIIFKVAEFA